MNGRFHYFRIISKTGLFTHRDRLYTSHTMEPKFENGICGEVPQIYLDMGDTDWSYLTSHWSIAVTCHSKFATPPTTVYTPCFDSP